MTYKVPAVRRHDYTIYLQDLDGATWLHCDVRRWSTEVAKRIKLDAAALYELHGGPWLALNEPAGCKKHAKFLRLFGFEFFQEAASNCGTQYIFRR